MARSAPITRYENPLQLLSGVNRELKEPLMNTQYTELVMLTPENPDGSPLNEEYVVYTLTNLNWNDLKGVTLVVTTDIDGTLSWQTVIDREGHTITFGVIEGS